KAVCKLGENPRGDRHVLRCDSPSRVAASFSKSRSRQLPCNCPKRAITAPWVSRRCRDGCRFRSFAHGRKARGLQKNRCPQNESSPWVHCPPLILPIRELTAE